MLHIIGLIVAVFMFFSFRSHDKKRREELLNWAIPLAVQIAQNQGWVSPHRLCSQLDLTQSDAQMVLRASAEKGFLIQAVNGRFYAHPEGQYITISPEEEVDASSKNSSGSIGKLIKFFAWCAGIFIVLVLLLSFIPDIITPAQKTTPTTLINEATPLINFPPVENAPAPHVDKKSHSHSRHK